jgi:hypothetical protein
MPKRGPEEKPMPTVWCMPDELWEKVSPILKGHDPPKPAGRPRTEPRAALDAIMLPPWLGRRSVRASIGASWPAPCARLRCLRSRRKRCSMVRKVQRGPESLPEGDQR